MTTGRAPTAPEDSSIRSGCTHQWTRKIAGKTVTRRLTEDQVARYGAWFDNARHARELLAELEALSLGIAERDDDLT